MTIGPTPTAVAGPKVVRVEETATCSTPTARPWRRVALLPAAPAGGAGETDGGVVAGGGGAGGGDVARRLERRLLHRPRARDGCSARTFRRSANG